MVKSIDEIYREFPDEERERRAPAAVEIRLGFPLTILLGMIVLGFFTVLVPFCHGIQH